MKQNNKYKWLSAWPLCLALLFVAGASAKEVSVRRSPEITLLPDTLNHRVCLYRGEKYSLGSVLVVEGVILECKPENHYESNGRLKWHRVDKK